MNELHRRPGRLRGGRQDCVDVAEAMIYNEWAQLLETTDPDTGELYQPDQFNVIDYNELGTAMLQDALWARAAWLAEGGNEDVATRFLRASFKGWIYCRDNPDDCVQYSLDHGSMLGRGPPGLDDERDQRAGLAGAGWDRSPRPGRAWPRRSTRPSPARSSPRQPADEAVPHRPRRGGAATGSTDATGDDWEKPAVEITPGGE